MAIDTQRARKERESEQDIPNGHARKEHLLVLHLQVGTLFGGACRRIPPSLLWASVDPPDSRPQRRRPPCRHLFIGGSCFLVLCPGRTCCPGPKICSSGPCHGGWLRRPSAPGMPRIRRQMPAGAFPGTGPHDGRHNLWHGCHLGARQARSRRRRSRSGGASLDHFVRAQHYRWGYGKAERL